MHTGEEDSLSFICRSHLSGVINHSLFVATRAASVNLEESGNIYHCSVVCITQSSRESHYYSGLFLPLVPSVERPPPLEPVMTAL